MPSSPAARVGGSHAPVRSATFYAPVAGAAIPRADAEQLGIAAQAPAPHVAQPTPAAAAAPAAPASPAVAAPAPPAAAAPLPTQPAYVDAVLPTADPDSIRQEKWAELWNAREDVSRRRVRQDIPQPTNKLVNAWRLVLASGVPASACMIDVTRVEPMPKYELQITGDQVWSEVPERALFEFMSRNRRQPTVAEKFVGHITGRTVEGKVIPLGWGELCLPPEPGAQANAGGWSAPVQGNGAPWMPGQAPPWGAPPWGWQSGPPWGGPPPWAGSHPWGAPPWAGPAYGAPWMGMQAAPPAPLADKPDLLALWNTMQQTMLQMQQGVNQGPMAALQTQLMTKIMERALADPKPASGGMLEGVKQLGEVASALDALRGDKHEGGPTVQMVEDGGGGKVPVIWDKNGKIDPIATGVVGGLGGLRTVAQQVRLGRAAKLNAASPTNGASGSHAPTRNGTNGAAK